MSVRSDVRDAAPGLPATWEELRTPEGERAVAVSRRHRRVQVLLAGGLALLLGVLAVIVARDEGHGTVVAALVLVALGASATYGALWLARRRLEWVLAPGELHLQRRFGPSAQLWLDVRTLELTVTRDADGDAWYELVAVGVKPGATRATRRRILRALHDAGEPRRLGAWLHAETGLPYRDDAGSEDEDAAAVDPERLRETLAGGGALSRWIARRLPKGG